MSTPAGTVDPSTYRPAPGEIPTSPGVCRFLDGQGRVIYVGKAKNLHQRLSNYSQDLAALRPRTQKMVTTACVVEWMAVSIEVEPLAPGCPWIKEFDPRSNAMYKDDKSYPYPAVTVGETYPRVRVVRGARKPGTRYFGPFVQAWSIRETVEQPLRVFPMCFCSAGAFRRAQTLGRPCLLGYIDECSVPCVGRISAQDHRALAEDFCAFIAGRTGPYLRQVEAEMKATAVALDFEKAARLRDDAAALHKVTEGNVVVLPDATDVDVFALTRDEFGVTAQVFHARGGRVRGQRGWIADLVDDAGDAEPIERLLEQVYASLVDPTDAGAVHHSGTPTPSGAITSVGVGDRAPSNPQPRSGPHDSNGDASRRKGESAAMSADDVAYTATTAVPKEVLVPELPSNAVTVQTWLAGPRGAKVDLRVPQRGDKAVLMDTVCRNMQEALQLHKIRRAGDPTRHALVLDELAEALDLPEAPLRVEYYDISHTQGTYQVGSMVVFEDGAPCKSDYRRFIVCGQDDSGAVDDTVAMHEVLTCRFKRLIAKRGRGEAAVRAAQEIEGVEGIAVASGPIDPETGKAWRFFYVSGLVIVDGGLPQVNAVRTVLDKPGIDVPLIGLVKRLEEVWVPGGEFPVILPRTSPALYLLQHPRDESHRFAITHHRKKRSADMTRSILDGALGLGPARQAAFLREFGSVACIRQADVDDITRVKGIGPALTDGILAHLNSPVTEQQYDFTTCWIDVNSKEHPV